MTCLRLPQERKARALVHADLSVLGHLVHRLAALRLPLAEEVDRHFRSLLQFHISRVQRPSLVRVRHVQPRSLHALGYQKRFPPLEASDAARREALSWPFYSASWAYGGRPATIRAMRILLRIARRRTANRESTMKTGPETLLSHPRTASRYSMKAKLQRIECDEGDLIFPPDPTRPVRLEPNGYATPVRKAYTLYYLERA